MYFLNSIIFSFVTFIISFKTKTDRSSDIRLTLQTRILDLNRKIYRSFDFPSLSVTVHHSWDKRRPNLCIFPIKI